MNSHGPWNVDDFEHLSWHDVHVHGLRLASVDERHGTADLVLDIDYILKWQKSDQGLEFTICPAELVFRDVFGLRFELDYATPAAGMCAFSIDGISREPVELAAGKRSYRWHMGISWPNGSLCFESPEFRLTLVGEVVVHSKQSLPPEKRVRVV